mgnify:FL=1
MQNLFSNQEPQKRELKLPDAEVVFYESFFSEIESKKIFKALKENIDWQQNEIKLFGKIHLEPRLTAWYGTKAYAYSGIEMQPKDFTKEILQIKNRVEEATNLCFNSCLLNYYRDGKDSMGWHQDNEKELGKNPAIASVSFGQERPFQMKHIENRPLKKVDILLSNGSLLLMKGAMQHFWQHKIPKTTRIIDERINLTFRKIL